MALRLFILGLSWIIIGCFAWQLSQAHPHELLNLEPSFFTQLGFSAYASTQEKVENFRVDEKRQGQYLLMALKTPLAVTWQVDDLFVDIHPASKATPTVDSTGIYFGTDTGIFYKISDQGKIVWSFRTESGQQGIHGSALIDDQQVYFGNYAGHFYCLKKATGELVWQSTVANAVGSSPLLFQDSIIFSAEFSQPKDGYLVSLNKKTGYANWVSERFAEQVHSSPTLATSEHMLGVGNNANYFLGIDALNGTVVWSYQTTGAIKGTALYYQGSFCFSSWDGRFRCLRAQDGKEVLSVLIDGKSQSSPAVDSQGNIFVSSAAGILYKINFLQKKIVAQVRLTEVISDRGLYSMSSPIVLMTAKKGEWVLSPCEKNKICLFEDSSLKKLQSLQVGGVVSGSFSANMTSIYFNVNARGLVRVN